MLLNVTSQQVTGLRRVLNGRTGTRGQRRMHRSTLSRRQWVAQITGATQDGSNRRWLYDWQEVIFDNDTTWTFQHVSGMRTSSELGQAVNLIEVQNGVAGYSGDGVDASDANYPANFNLLSMAGGSPLVMMWLVPTSETGSNLSVRPVFQEGNQHFGSC